MMPSLVYSWLHTSSALGAGAVGLDDVEVVVVVAELSGLRLGRLAAAVEGGRARQDRVAPPQDRVPAVAGRDGDVVDGGGDGRDRGERQVAGLAVTALAAASGRPGRPPREPSGPR